MKEQITRPLNEPNPPTRGGSSEGGVLFQCIMGDFVKLNRSILKWEWYHNIPVRILFLHLILSVNWKSGKFEGADVHPGEIVTSLENLAVSTGLTTQQIRTAISKLKSTNEITSRSTSKFTVITLVNWAKYQNTQQAEQQAEQHSINKPSTNDQQTINNNRRSKEVKKERKEEEVGGVAIAPTDTPQVSGNRSKRKPNPAPEPEELFDHFGITPEEAERSNPKFAGRNIDFDYYGERISIYSDQKGLRRSRRGWLATYRQFIGSDEESKQLRLRKPKFIIPPGLKPPPMFTDADK